MSALFQFRSLNFNNMIFYPDTELPAGKIAFIAGKSGSGKSTLLKLMNASLSPAAGTICYRGRDIAELDTIILRQKISLVSQDVFLFDGTISENFRLFYRYRNMEPPANERMIFFLTLCRLEMPLDKEVMTMSGGERQRLYIAVFLSFSPDVLLLDEPTSALDHENAAAVLENLTGYCKKQKTELIIVSHDLRLIQSFSEHTLRLEKRNEE